MYGGLLYIIRGGTQGHKECRRGLRKHPGRGLPTSKTTCLPLSDCCNIAKYDLPYSHRRTGYYSCPDSVFFRIMTSKIRGLREKRYNRACNRPRCTRIPAGVFWGGNRHLRRATGHQPRRSAPPPFSSSRSSRTFRNLKQENVVSLQTCDRRRTVFFSRVRRTLRPIPPPRLLRYLGLKVPVLVAQQGNNQENFPSPVTIGPNAGKNPEPVRIILGKENKYIHLATCER
jgi:hypothetical protein